MSGFALYIGTSLALILVIEGLIYALFPDSVRRMMALAVALPPSRLRLFGLAAAATGFCMVWVMRAAGK